MFSPSPPSTNCPQPGQTIIAPSPRWTNAVIHLPPPSPPTPPHGLFSTQQPDALRTIPWPSFPSELKASIMVKSQHDNGPETLLHWSLDQFALFFFHSPPHSLCSPPLLAVPPTLPYLRVSALAVPSTCIRYPQGATRLASHAWM